MKKILVLLWVVWGVIACRAQEAPSGVQVGDKVKAFTLLDQAGNPFRFDSVLGKKNLVIYFYPKDDSPGCTKEACRFRDEFETFKDADALVIGISGQGVESHKAFAQKYHLSFTLLCDTDNQVRKQFKVKTDLLGLLPGRVTFVVDKTGTIVYIFSSQINATEHVDQALRILKGL